MQFFKMKGLGLEQQVPDRHPTVHIVIIIPVD